MGVFFAGVISFARIRASSARPRSVRSPQRTMTWAEPAMAAKSYWKLPWELFLQCRSPTAATRMVVPPRTVDDLPGRLDGRRPLRDLLRGERAARHQAPVGVPPARDVRQVLLTRQKRSLADALVGRGPTCLPLEESAEADHHLGRYGRHLTRVDEAEERQMAQEHPPVSAKAGHQSVPLELPLTGADEMGDVGSVVAFALHDEGFRPDHLLGWTQPDGHSEHPGGAAVGEPIVVHLGQAIARAVDDVDVIPFHVCLAEPVRKGQIRVEARRGQAFEEGERVAPADEDVQVLRASDVARVVAQRVSASHEEWDLQSGHPLQGTPMASALDLPFRALALARASLDRTHAGQRRNSMTGTRPKRREYGRAAACSSTSFIRISLLTLSIATQGRKPRATRVGVKSTRFHLIRPTGLARTVRISR